MPTPVLTFARFVTTPENQAAWLAVRDVAARLRSTKVEIGGHASRNEFCAFASPLVLHGPPGSGKTHLAHALVADAARHRADLIANVLSARELTRAELPSLFADEENEAIATPIPALQEARHCDLLIVEDVQHLNPRTAEALVQVIDYFGTRRRPIVITANAGPQRLAFRGERFPARLTNRLAAGLVVALGPLGPASRLLLLQTLAQRRQVAVPTEILRWLADRVNGGGRQLESTIARLQTLIKMHRGPLDVATVEAQFRDETGAGGITMECIAERVGGYFRVEPDELQSRRRYRNVLLPRQVGMYLARQLTELSLEQIGKYFGGRDHSTVLHACRKVELVLRRDALLSGAIREIHAGLA